MNTIALSVPNQMIQSWAQMWASQYLLQFIRESVQTIKMHVSYFVTCSDTEAELWIEMLRKIYKFVTGVNRLQVL